jgi:hypothetical protein
MGVVPAAGVALDLALEAVLPRAAMANRIFIPALTVSFAEIAPLAPAFLRRDSGRHNDGPPSQRDPVRDEPQESLPEMDRPSDFASSSNRRSSTDRPPFPMLP